MLVAVILPLLVVGVLAVDQIVRIPDPIRLDQPDVCRNQNCENPENPRLHRQASGTIHNCYAYSDLMKGIQCFAVMSINGLITVEAAEKGIKTFAAKFPPDEVMYAIGITNKFGIKLGVIYDPHGQIIGLNWRSLRWGKPTKGVIHHKDTKPITFIHPWNSVDEIELMNHWTKYTALTGVKGFNLAYALGGHANGISTLDEHRKGCEKINSAMRNNVEYYSYVSIFLSANEICFEPSDRYDVVLGDYDIKKTLVDGMESEAYIPKWECKLGARAMQCSGLMPPAVQEKLLEIVALN